MDDKPEGMPEFDKPSELPAVPPTPVIKPKKERCQAIAKSGLRCGFYPQSDKKYCCTHDPEIPAAQKRVWRQHNGSKAAGIPRIRAGRPKSKTDLIVILSERLDRFLLRFGSDSKVEVEEVVCHIIRTIGYIMSVDADEAGGIKGWRMPKTGS